MFKDRTHQWIYLFTEGKREMKPLLGGKGANVADMLSAGLPVPPGFIITTEACNAYLEYGGQFPEGMWSQAKTALKAIEADTGRRLGDTTNPLLVSVRSGAAVSMPGMMDTVLNLGLNDETAEGLAVQTGDRRFALDAYRRFISMFGHIVMNVDSSRFERVLDRVKAKTPNNRDTDLTESQLEEIIEAYKAIVFAHQHGQAFPQDVEQQLRMAISAVFDSWNRQRAIDYRRVHGIPNDLGTAVNVQAMVFGNMGWDSGTGVAFTRHPSTGEKRLFGEYLLNAQGEDVVAGIRTPDDVHKLADDMPEIYEQLQTIANQLEGHYGDMQDIEFTIQQGKLWLLQTRTGKRTGMAAIKIAVDMVNEGLIDRGTALKRVQPQQLDQLLHPMVDPNVRAEVLTTGLPASPGAAVGRVEFSPEEAARLAADNQPVILVRQETSPDDFQGMVDSVAILTARGGMTSHAAVVARGMGKPCVVGAKALHISYDEGIVRVDNQIVRRGDWLTELSCVLR